MVVVISQILTIISNYCASCVVNKRDIILFKIVSSFFNAISILLVGNIVGSIVVFFTMFRGVICLFKDRFKTNLPIYLICAGYVAIGICGIPFYTNIIDIVPVLVSMPAAIILWFCDPSGIKVGVGIGDSLWMIYDLYNGLYLSALNIFVNIIISMISLIRMKLKAL